MVCLQATPLVLPSLEVMMYPYLNKSKSWSFFDSNKVQQDCKQQSLFAHRAPIISFIRACDDCKVNKSKLINSLFSDLKSPAFLTRD